MSFGHIISEGRGRVKCEAVFNVNGPGGQQSTARFLTPIRLAERRILAPAGSGWPGRQPGQTQQPYRTGGFLGVARAFPLACKHAAAQPQ
jgi:hypothetical protein